MQTPLAIQENPDVSIRERVADAAFPAQSGVYIVWDAEEGGARPLYVGVAATQTIERRWRRQHLVDRAGDSPLRRALGVQLGLVERKLSVKRDGRFYPPVVEEEITRFLRSCEIEFRPATSPEEALEFERALIEKLRPRLNVRRRPRVARTPKEREVLREAKTLYEERVKPALLEGLRAANPRASIEPATDYVSDIPRDNLLPGISLAEIEAEFTDAATTSSSKMRAPWSSSALAVNWFARWRSDATFLPLAGRVGFDARFKFEEQCPNGVSAIAPHLDVVLRRPGEVVAVESKCTEFIQGGDHGPVAASYKRLADRGDERAASRSFAALDHVEQFLLLDGYQLVKHYLGLRNLDEKQLTLVYLYWEPANALEGPGADLFALHRREVAEFARLVEGDETCEFLALSYPDYWAELDALPEQPSWLVAHLKLLQTRYLVEL